MELKQALCRFSGKGRIMANEFYEVGDGYRASELFPVDSLWYVNADLPGVEYGEIVRVYSVDDGSNGEHDNTRVETSNGCYTALEALELFESAARLEAVIWN